MKSKKETIKTKDYINGYHKASTKICVPNKVNPSIANINSTADKKCQGFADCFEGKVTDIVDGDTLDVNNVRIRLALVNTPELTTKTIICKDFTMIIRI